MVTTVEKRGVLPPTSHPAPGLFSETLPEPKKITVGISSTESLDINFSLKAFLTTLWNFQKCCLTVGKRRRLPPTSHPAPGLFSQTLPETKKITVGNIAQNHWTLTSL